MTTPQLHIDAIRFLQKAVSLQATQHFDTEPDGSYQIDVALFEAIKSAR